MTQLGSLFPVRYVLPAAWQIIEQEIFFNWLDVEVPGYERYADLEKIRGWRNREVHAFIANWDWTRTALDTVANHEYEIPSDAFLRLHSPYRHVPLVRMH